MNKRSITCALWLGLALGFSNECAAQISFFASEFEAPTRFYKVDAVTGQTTQIGTTRFSPGLDFHQNGVLYGASSSLYRINALNGTATTVGALPDLLGSIAFAPGNRLYGVS